MWPGKPPIADIEIPVEEGPCSMTVMPKKLLTALGAAYDRCRGRVEMTDPESVTKQLLTYEILSNGVWRGKFPYADLVGP